jgi:heptosyltransferase II
MPAAAPGGVLVVQTSFIGDMVLTTPLIASLAAASRRPVSVLAIPSTAILLRNNPDVADVIVRQRAFAEAYFAQGSMRSAALGAAARVRLRVGFESSSGRRLYTVRVPYDESSHHARRLESLMEPVYGRDRIGGSRPRLFPGDDDVASAEAVLQSAGHAGEPLVALAPGSIWGTKRWPFYPELAALLAGRFRPVIIGGAADRSLAREILAQCPSAIDATSGPSLLASAHLIGRCSAIVTNDSAPQHLASAMGTPTVSIFGPTVPEFGFGPLAQPSDVVGHDGLACRPCDRHGPQRCPLGHWLCMREIDAPLVAQAVQRLTSTSN